MIKYIIFNQEELDRIRNGGKVTTIDDDCTSIFYVSKETFEEAISKTVEDTVEPCDFCSNFSLKNHENHIEKDEDGCFNIWADTGDPWEWGIVEKIKYCPYCGRLLEDNKSE